MAALEHTSHPLAQVSDAEVLTVAVVAAKYYQNHHERALYGMRECGYLSGQLSISRFNRRSCLCQYSLAITVMIEKKALDWIDAYPSMAYNVVINRKMVNEFGADGHH